MTKRWRLQALVVESDFPELAEAVNRQPQRFWTRRGAVRAKRFYESRLYLPVEFIIVSEKEMLR